MHTSVLLHEAVEALAIKPDGIYVDGTFGRGGHSRMILSLLDERGRLIALDKDPAAIAFGEMLQDERFSIHHCGFSLIQQKLLQLGIEEVEGILLDLGVSSPQLEETIRGFSFRLAGPLDMRMDTSRGQTAAEWLAVVSEDQLERVIRDYGEERYARQIARAIIVARARQPIVTTLQLAEIVAAVVRARQSRREAVRHPATRTFQAIRIYINQELEELSLALPQCVDLLKPGGRLVIISFHSLEDRMVKQFIRKASTVDEPPRGIPMTKSEIQRLSKPALKRIGQAVRPGSDEVEENVRARSAIMRVAEKQFYPG